MVSTLHEPTLYQVYEQSSALAQLHNSKARRYGGTYSSTSILLWCTGREAQVIIARAQPASSMRIVAVSSRADLLCVS